MIYIFMALYAEAKPLIQKLELRKLNSFLKFEQYLLEDKICLTLTGCGSIAASTVVGAVCACREIKESDILINIGTCAGSKLNMNKIYAVNKLTDTTNGRTFYPDMLYRHGFQEAELLTLPTIMTKGCEGGEDDQRLYDMEGAAIYQAASFFLGPHQIQFLKAISDGGEGDKLTPDHVSDCIESHLEKIIDYIGELIDISREQEERLEVFTEGEKCFIEQLVEDLHCSRTMRAEVVQLCRFWKLSNVDYKRNILGKYERSLLPTRDKREGKRLLDELRKELL